MLETGDWQFVFAATTFASSIFRSFEIDAQGQLAMYFPEHFDARSQDLPDALHDAGQFYWGTAAAWLNHSRIFAAHSAVVTVPRWRVHDIDTEEDWRCAEITAASLAIPASNE